MTTKRSVVATAVLLLTGMGALAACGQPPSSSGGAAAAGEGAGGDLEEVYAELEGLEGEERLARLEELAADEDADLTWYTSMNLEDSKPVTDGFKQEYPDIEVEIYRASSSDVLQRVLQESSAGYQGADLVSANGPELQVLAGKDLLLPLETPTRKSIFPAAQFDTWLGIYLNVFAAGWNTNEVSESDAPKTWEDVLSNYGGDLAMELEDWDWFATLVTEYFMKKKGMTEPEAINLFREAAKDATVVDGHTTMAELMVAGQYKVVTSAYQHRLVQMETDGAPVGWEPPPEPLVIRPNGIGINRNTDAPATALLFIEYALNKGQETVVDVHRTPANTEYGGLPTDLEAIPIDFDRMIKERDKWEKLYAQIVEGSSEVVEEQ